MMNASNHYPIGVPNMDNQILKPELSKEYGQEDAVNKMSQEAFESHKQVLESKDQSDKNLTVTPEQQAQNLESKPTNLQDQNTETLDIPPIFTDKQDAKAKPEK